ncbi:trypsin-like serine protease [Streptomyces sp. NPDC091371]|uniref:trypsin-like serine protease n=1 Tax=Streptomyces sp. NPDC091371 TaxID=3155303 RepID=UPI00342765BA
MKTRTHLTRFAVAATAVAAAGLLTAPAAHALEGSEVTADKAFQYTARIQIGTGAAQQNCTGTLIAPQWMATAYSCFAADPTAPAKATLGTRSLSGPTAQVVEIDVVNRVAARPEVALVHLKQEPRGVEPLRLFKVDEDMVGNVGVTGFGGDQLRLADLWAGNSEGYWSLMPGWPEPGLPVQAVCEGDIGAPYILASREGGHRLAGVVTETDLNSCHGAGGPYNRSKAAIVNGWREIPSMHAAMSLPRLDAGQTLRAGETVRGKNTVLTLQADGNLVLTHAASGELWASGTWGAPGAQLRFQPDGNLVLYRQDGSAVWSSGTWGNPGARLDLQDDGNLVVYRQDGSAAWSTGTWRVAPVLRGGQNIGSGQWTSSATATLVMTNTGSLGTRDIATGANVSGFSAYSPGAYARMQADGNFVVYKKDGGEGKGGALWSTGTWGNPGARLVLQDDGNLVLYKKDSSEILWQVGDRVGPWAGTGA